MRFGPLKPSFINTYSLNFDGVDDYVFIENGIFDATNGLTLSFWVKYDGVGAGTNWLFSNGGIGGVNSQFNTRLAPDGRWFNYLVGGSFYTGIAGLNDGNWHHLTQVIDYQNSIMHFYKDGIKSTATRTSTYSQVTWGTISTPFFPFKGQVDEVTLIGRVLTQSEITSISSKPTDLTPLNPIAWYRMGDNGAYKDPQWLIPNNENKDKVSNYSFQLDGINDYINCGDSDDFSFGDGVTDSPFSVSMWFNLSSFNTNNVVFSKDSGLPNREYAMGFFGTSKKLRFFIKNQGSNSQQSIDSTTLFSTDTWYNVVCTYDGSGGSNAADGMNIYVNSILETPTNVIKQTYIAMSNTTAPVNIGQYGAAASFLPAKVDEFSVYNTELLQANVDSIYKGGIPTTILGAFTYWKLGENATLLADWTIPDEVGTNDGTSVSMNFLDRVGTAPSSSNNALSFNMDLINRVEDTPPNP